MSLLIRKEERATPKARTKLSSFSKNKILPYFESGKPAFSSFAIKVKHSGVVLSNNKLPVSVVKAVYKQIASSLVISVLEISYNCDISIAVAGALPSIIRNLPKGVLFS